jgi:hypothetical protein
MRLPQRQQAALNAAPGGGCRMGAIGGGNDRQAADLVREQLCECQANATPIGGSDEGVDAGLAQGFERE